MRISSCSDGDRLVVAYREHDVLRWLVPKTGTVLREVSVPQPRAVVAGENGAVFVLSGARFGKRRGARDAYLLWLNDVLIADDVRFESAPVRLVAGHSYDVRFEYVSPGIAKPEFAFSWASNTKEWQRVPTANLHADTAPVGPAVRVTAEKTSAIFTLADKQPKPLTVRFRQTGTDAVTTAGQVIIPATALSASVAVAVEKGPRKIVLGPSADYRGDGTAGAVTVGSVPSVTDGLAAAYLLDEARGRTIHDSSMDELHVFTFNPSTDNPVAALTPVPEPASAVLLGFAAMGLLARRRPT